MTLAQRQRWINEASEDELRLLYQSWGLWARDKQLPPQGDWRIWLLLAGRGFGKTRAGAEWINELAAVQGHLQIALVGATFDDVRIAEKQSLMRARHKRFMTAAKSEADWQALMADAARHSWKDEAWTICFILIFFMCFVPSLQDHVATGFAILQTTPDWFQWAVLASIGASFGLRGFDKWQTKPPTSSSAQSGGQ